MSIAFEARSEIEGTDTYSPEAPATPRNAFSAEVVDRLLDLLSSDDDFRELFQKDPRAALLQVGHVTPEQDRSVRGTDPVMCLVLKNKLASKDEIRAGWNQIATALTSTQVHHIFSMSSN